MRSVTKPQAPKWAALPERISSTVDGRSSPPLRPECQKSSPPASAGHRELGGKLPPTLTALIEARVLFIQPLHGHHPAGGQSRPLTDCSSTSTVI